MIELPPPLLLPAAPAIILPVEGGGVFGSADLQMQRLGLSREVRRAVLSELRKVIGGKPEIVKATVEDLSRYAKQDLAFVPGMAGAMRVSAAAAPPPPSGPTVTYCGTGTTGDVFNIGTATADRVVIGIAMANRGSSSPRTLSTLNYDGAAGSDLVTTGAGAGTNSVTIGMSQKLITTGTTVTMTSTYSGGVSVNRMYVFTVQGQASNTPGATKAWKTGDAAATFAVAASSCVVMAAAAADGTLGDITFVGINIEDNDQTWTGITNFRGAVGRQTGLSANATYPLSVSSTANAHVFVAHTYA